MTAREQTLAELVKGARQRVNEFEQSGQDTDPIDDALDALTAQLQAAQATIAEALTVIARDVEALANLDPTELRVILRAASIEQTEGDRG